MTHPLDLIEVQGGSSGGQTDRKVVIPGIWGADLTIRRWHDPEPEVCWLLINAQGRTTGITQVRLSRDQLRALGLACIQAATGTGEA